jgi:hypothetical protein
MSLDGLYMLRMIRWKLCQVRDAISQSNITEDTLKLAGSSFWTGSNRRVERRSDRVLQVGTRVRFQIQNEKLLTPRSLQLKIRSLIL